MSDSDRGFIGLLILGVGYAIIKLGDELLVASDEILRLFVRLFEESLAFRLSINDFLDWTSEQEITLETIVLILLALFLLTAIADYVTSEMK